MTFITMGIVCVCLGLLVALFIYNKFIGFFVSTIVVIIMLITAKRGDQKLRREMLARVSKARTKEA